MLPEEDIEVKVSSFYSKIRDPVLSNLSLSFTNPSIRVTQLLPSALPDLFNGDMLVVFGRYSGQRRGGSEDHRHIQREADASSRRTSASRRRRAGDSSFPGCGPPGASAGFWTR